MSIDPSRYAALRDSVPSTLPPSLRPHLDAVREITRPLKEKAAFRQRVLDLFRGKKPSLSRRPSAATPTDAPSPTPPKLPPVTAETISPRQLRRLGPRLALARLNRQRGPHRPIRLARVMERETAAPPEVLDALGVLIAASDGGRELRDAEVIERAKAIWQAIQGSSDAAEGGGPALGDLDALYATAVAMKKKGLGVEYPAPEDADAREAAAGAMEKAGFRRVAGAGTEKWEPDTRRD